MEVNIKEGIDGSQIFEIVTHEADENIEPALKFINLQKRFDQMLAMAPSRIIDVYSSNYPQFRWVNTESPQGWYEGNVKSKEAKPSSYLFFSKDFTDNDLMRGLPLKTHVTTLNIDLDALAHNLSFYKSQLRPSTGLMVMVKALAYGAGLLELTHFLTQLPVDYLCVAFTDEGVKLRQSGIKLPILVLNTTVADVPNLVHYHLDTELYDLHQIKEFIAYCEKNKCQLTGHLMINTGMNRLGFDPNDQQQLQSLLTGQKVLDIKACMTHLAASNDPKEEAFTRAQCQKFDKAVQNLFPNPKQQPFQHVLNTGGILRYPDQQRDMVRLGIGLYGLEVNGWSQEELKVVSSFKTKISQLHEVQKGDTVGYGRAGKITKPSTIAVLPVGYGDGYLRDYGMGKAYVEIQGQKAATVGNICMDMCMVDVTDMNLKVGDEVTLFGENPTISHLAHWSNSIAYEVLTQVSERVQRVFKKRF